MYTKIHVQMKYIPTKSNQLYFEQAEIVPLVFNCRLFLTIIENITAHNQQVFNWLDDV